MAQSFRSTLITLIGCLSLFTFALGQDSSGVRCLSKIHAWDAAYAVATTGNYVYVITGGGLKIVDFHDPANPQEIGFCASPITASGVVVAGNYAYVAVRNYGLQIVNISFPTHPVEVGFFDTQGIANNVTISGNYAYVADGTDGLRIIDISNSDSLREVGFYLTRNANSVSIAGNYAYLADGDSGLFIISISNPRNPQRVSCFSGSANNVAVSGNFAYLLGNNNGTMRIINISNPTTPVQVGSYSYYATFTVSDAMRGIAVAGNRVFLGCETYYAYHGYNGTATYLFVIDVSNPASPRLATSIIMELPYSIAQRGNYTFVAGGRSCMNIFNSQIPDSTTLTSIVGLPKSAVYSEIAGHYEYLQNYWGSIDVIDIQNPNNPQISRIYDLSLSGYGAYTVSNNFLYGICAGPTYNLLRIHNVSNPNNPQNVGFCSLSQLTYNNHRRIITSGNYAYATCDSLTGQKLCIVNVTNPASPNIVSNLLIPTSNDLSVSGNFVYLATNSGLSIVNVANPANPQIVGTDSIGIGKTISVFGNNAFVVCSDSILRVINVSDPSNTRLVGQIRVRAIPGKIISSDNYIFMAVGTKGIRIINVSNPASPSEIGYYDTPGNTYSISVRGDTIYAADSSSFGVFVRSTLGVVDRASDAIPQNFSLKQNYPNPFNSSTTIEYSLPKTSKVELKLFDVSGREAGTLVNFSQNPGTYRVTLDATQLSSGIYFYRLSACEFQETRKLSILK